MARRPWPSLVGMVPGPAKIARPLAGEECETLNFTGDCARAPKPTGSGRRPAVLLPGVTGSSANPCGSATARGRGFADEPVAPGAEAHVGVVCPRCRGALLRVESSFD